MPVSLVRIDDRLIHGQVVVGWVNALNANYIIVVNDEAAEDDVQKCLLKMSVPQSLKIDIFSTTGFNLHNDSKEIKENKVIILLANVKDCFKLIEKGFKIDFINVGGMRYLAGKREITRSIFLSDEDIEDFKKLAKLGIKIELRMIPADRGMDIFDCLAREGCYVEKN